MRVHIFCDTLGFYYISEAISTASFEGSPQLMRIAYWVLDAHITRTMPKRLLCFQVLRCLTDKMDEITVEECKAEVFYFEKMEVRDFRNDVILAEACRKDVESLCNEVERGEPPTTA